MPSQTYEELTQPHAEILTVTVYPDSIIPDEICEQIIAFGERACEVGGDIVVHCNEGRFRSRVVANFFWRFFDDYDHTGEEWQGGEMRDLNYKSLYNHYKATRERKAQ